MSVFTMLRRMRGAGRHTSSAVAECSAGSWLRREMPKAGVYLRQSGGKGEQRCVSLCARSRHATHRVELGLGEATQDDPQAGIRLRNESRAISLAGSSPHERSAKKLARRAPVRRWRTEFVRATWAADGGEGSGLQASNIPSHAFGSATGPWFMAEHMPGS